MQTGFDNACCLVCRASTQSRRPDSRMSGQVGSKKASDRLNIADDDQDEQYVRIIGSVAAVIQALPAGELVPPVIVGRTTRSLAVIADI